MDEKCVDFGNRWNKNQYIKYIFKKIIKYKQYLLILKFSVGFSPAYNSQTSWS